MRASRTLAWSLAREIIRYGLVGFAATSLVLIAQNVAARGLVQQIRSAQPGGSA